VDTACVYPCSTAIFLALAARSVVNADSLGSGSRFLTLVWKG
jgi:hypothetical protein